MKALFGLALVAAIAFFWSKAGLFHTGFLGEDFAYLRYQWTDPKPWLWGLIYPNEFGQFRPLGHQLYFLFMRSFFGLNPYAFHAVQLILHLGNALLCFQLLRKLAGKETLTTMLVAFVSTFLWAIQAAHGKAIFWAAATNNLLYTFLGLLLCCYLLQQDKNKKWFSLVLFLCALGSKEFAVLIPIFLFLTFEEKIPSLKKRIVCLLPIFLLGILYMGYRFFMSHGMASNFTPHLGENTWPAISNYFYLASHSLEPLPLLFWLTFFLLALFQRGARGFFLLPIAVLFLSLWPEHVMPEFLYFPLIGAAIALQACVLRAFTHRYLEKFMYLFLLIAVLALIPREFTAAKNTQQYLSERSEIFTLLRGELEKIPQAIENQDRTFWTTLNARLGNEAIHAPWYVELYWPNRFPCLADNFRKSFSNLGAKNSVTTLTPSLFQCASSSK